MGLAMQRIDKAKIDAHLSVQSESQHDLGALLLCIVQLPVAAAVGRASQRGDESVLDHGLLVSLCLLGEDTFQRSVQLVEVVVEGLLEAGSAARVKVTCIACTLDLSEHTYIAGREGWRGRV